MRNNQRVPLILAATLIAIAIAVRVGAAGPAAPGTMAFTARLQRDGVAYDGALSLRLALHRSATDVTPIWSEQLTTTATAGLIAVRMGEQTPLTGSLLAGGELYLAVTILDGDPGTSLQPRLPIGSVPYALSAERAAFAEETAAVPTGAVMYFDLAECPAGWSPLEAARGRAIVGLPGGGTLGGTVGEEPLGDLEDRLHSHTVGIGDIATSIAGQHGHLPGSGSLRTESTSVPHTHTVDPPDTGTSWSSHKHDWAGYDSNAHQWFSYDSAGTGMLIADWGNGMGGGGNGQYPLKAPGGDLYTSTEWHQHTVDIPSTATSAATATAHTHDILLPVDGAHSHTVAIGDRTSQPAKTGNVMPYLQLLVCRKN